MNALALAQAVMALMPVAIEHGPMVVASFKALLDTIRGDGVFTPEQQAQFDRDWDAMRQRLSRTNADWESASRP